MAFPIVFKMMDKRGNSNTEERMELIRRFCALAGESGIAHLVADREFVGSEWFAFLNSRGIHYHIRIRENFRVIRHGKESKAHWPFADLKLGECKHLSGIYIHENIKEIKVLHHGRKAKSLFKYGMEYISQCLLNHTNRYRIDIFNLLSYT